MWHRSGDRTGNLRRQTVTGPVREWAAVAPDALPGPYTEQPRDDQVAVASPSASVTAPGPCSSPGGVGALRQNHDQPEPNSMTSLPADVECEQRDCWAGPKLPAASGLNLLRRDPRTDPAATSLG